MRKFAHYTKAIQISLWMIVYFNTTPLLGKPSIFCTNIPNCRDEMAEGENYYRKNELDKALSTMLLAERHCASAGRAGGECEDPSVAYRIADMMKLQSNCDAAIKWYNTAKRHLAVLPNEAKIQFEPAIDNNIKHPTCTVAKNLAPSVSPRPASKSDSAFASLSTSQSRSSAPLGMPDSSSEQKLLKPFSSQPESKAPASPVTINNHYKCDFSHTKIENNDGLVNLCGSIGQVGNISLNKSNRKWLWVTLLSGGVALGGVLALGLGLGLVYRDYVPPKHTRDVPLR